MQIPEDWLVMFNKRVADEGVPHATRPWIAMLQWSKERNCGISFPSPEAAEIIAWFERHSPAGSHAIGPLFTGTYFFDSYFWKISIPPMYGTVTVNLLQFLEGMPETIASRLRNEASSMREYANVAADCLDYAYACDDIGKGGANVRLPPFAMQLFGSANGYLRGTVDLLVGLRPNSRAMETARLATEMFLKAYLAVHFGLDEVGAKDLGHNLRKILNECRTSSLDSEFDAIAPFVDAFPPITARYEGSSYCAVALWNSFAAAQQVGTIFGRSVTDRDARNLVFGVTGTAQDKS